MLVGQVGPQARLRCGLQLENNGKQWKQFKQECCVTGFVVLGEVWRMDWGVEKQGQTRVWESTQESIAVGVCFGGGFRVWFHGGRKQAIDSQCPADPGALLQAWKDVSHQIQYLEYHS